MMTLSLEVFQQPGKSPSHTVDLWQEVFCRSSAEPPAMPAPTSNDDDAQSGRASPS